jgi:hypothetical protein
MPRPSVQRSPQVRHAPFLADLTDSLVRMQIERGSEAHPGDPELQIAYDEYLDAIALANRSGRGEDMITAGKLYLRYAAARDAQESLI